MEEEQEGINLGEVNLEEEGMELPGTEEENNTEQGTSEQDEQKEAFKRDINKERTRRKEAERKNKELEARILALEEKKANTKTTVEKLVESGVDESIAKSIAGAIDEKETNSKKVEQDLANMKFKLELSEKSKDSNFSDIMDYEDDIKELVDKGLNIEQAYYALNYDKAKTNNTKSEIERKVEAKMQNNQARKEIIGNIVSNTGVVPNSTSKPKATAVEIAAAKMAGMDINDYLAAKNADSIKQYNDYNKKKAK